MTKNTTKTKKIDKFPAYKISSAGKIYHSKKGSKTEVKQYTNKDGYQCVKLWDPNADSTKTRFVHRLVADHFLDGKQGNDAQANHVDGNKKHNTVGNLQWVSQSDNMQHAFDTGLEKPPTGESNSQSKLSDKEVKKIAAKDKTGVPRATIAKDFGVSKALISRILNKGTPKSPQRHDLNTAGKQIIPTRKNTKQKTTKEYFELRLDKELLRDFIPGFPLKK